MTAGSKPTSFFLPPSCLFLSFTPSTLTNDNNEIRKSSFAIFVFTGLVEGGALTALTPSNDLWPLVRFQTHHIPARFSPVSGQSANIHECARRRNTSGTLTTLGTIFNETAEEKPFISKGNEINCGIFSYFSWVCVFYILSPIFTEIKRAPRKRCSCTIKIKSDHACSRTFWDVLRNKYFYEINYCKTQKVLK